MAEIYRLRMLSDENDNFVREYDVPARFSLLDLHDFISNDLGYDKEGVVSFFASDEQWNKLAEFTLVDMGDGGPVPMQDVEVGDVMKPAQARLIYLFDIFNERALYIESGGKAEAAEELAYPRVALSQADAPGQYEQGGQPGSGSIFDEAMDEFGEFEGDDYYDDEF